MSSRWWSAILLAALVLGGCAGSPGPTLATPPISQPRSTGIAVTAEQLATTDPCALLDPAALAPFGTVRVDGGLFFGTCYAQAGRSRVFVEFTAEVTLPPSGWATSTRQNVSVINNDGSESDEFCGRFVIVSEAAAIEIRVAADESPSDACPLADAVLDGMLPSLTRGDPPQHAAAPESLLFDDACTTLDPEMTAQVPGIDPTRYFRSFAGQTCNWGSNSIAEPRVSVLLTRSSPELDRQVETVGDRRAVRRTLEAITATDGSYTTKPECTLEIDWRPLDRPARYAGSEIVMVIVAADQPIEVSCDQAKEFATTVVERLSAG